MLTHSIYPSLALTKPFIACAGLSNKEAAAMLRGLLGSIVIVVRNKKPRQSTGEMGTHFVRPVVGTEGFGITLANCGQRGDGVVVLELEPGFPAHRAGLLVGDVIVRLSLHMCNAAHTCAALYPCAALHTPLCTCASLAHSLRVCGSLKS